MSEVVVSTSVAVDPNRFKISFPIRFRRCAELTSITRRDLEARAEGIIEMLRIAGANLSVVSARQAIEEAAEPLESRGIIVVERGRFRVRDRNVLRYYARTIQHLLTGGRKSPRTH